MFESFNKQSKLVKILLLLIPFVNWITELVTRWDYYSKKKTTASLIIALIVTFLGLPVGFIDCICILLTNNMALTDQHQQ
ncbi:MAG: hypothetical protein MJ208_00775 [Bacilli bacterium]|nr:hypothetical protein [Bacilli bacterium]